MDANGGGLEDGGDHAPANGGGHALANGGDQAPAMEAGGAFVNGGVGVMAAPHGVVPAQAGPDVLYPVFLYLPAQEIARCRRVCRLWRDITGTEDFRRHHHGHRSRTPMPLFYFQGPGPFDLRAVDIRDSVPRPVIRYPSHHDVLRIHGSCAGILLLSSDARLYACNPCTRRWVRLPPLHVDNRIVGFYAEERNIGNFECRVLYRDRQAPECEYSIYDLHLGPLAAARSIGRPALDGAHDDDLDLVLAYGIAPSYRITPVYILGCLHWPPRATRANVNRDILVFDASVESFSLVPSPGNQGVGDQLFEIDQHLAMVVPFSPSRVDVWVRSNLTELWSRRYIIRLPMFENNACRSVFAVAQDRNVLVQIPCGHIMLQCDALGNMLQSYHLAGHQTFLYRHAIQESLLLYPTILLMQDADAVDGDPPFFRNQ